jgi:hypothetical protein
MTVHKEPRKIKHNKKCIEMYYAIIEGRWFLLLPSPRRRQKIAAFLVHQWVPEASAGLLVAFVALSFWWWCWSW